MQEDAVQLVSRLLRRIRNEIDMRKVLRARSVEFQNDPNNRPDLVAEGLRPRPQTAVDDSQILQRIVNSYRRARLAWQNAAAAYQVSNEWLPIYNKNLQPVIKALTNGNLCQLAGMYRNFFRDSCSTGLVGLPDMNRRFFRGPVKRKDALLYLYDVLCRYKLWRELLENSHQASSLVSPSIGNPFGFLLDGSFVTHGSDYLHYYATKINQLVADDDHAVIVELGGGYGGMAYFLFRDNAKLTYIDFDLPENLALTAYYLLRAFPQLKIILYGEEDLCHITLRDNSLVLMPNFELHKLGGNIAAVVFNSYSLAEMSAEAIKEYINQLGRIGGRYFFHVNHTTRSLVSADDFGIEQQGFSLMYRNPALWTRGRTMSVDECEYLYKKSSAI
jgi:putative sugar O-methyltransferase